MDKGRRQAQKREGCGMKSIVCPYCRKKIGTWKSLLGGRATDWHKPRKGSKAPTIGKSDQCLGSGTVLNEPRP